jgi:iron-sulfur cluster assembly accessory protein
MIQASPLTLELTPAAETFIRRMMRFNAASKAGFRLKVRQGGCSGFAVGFDLATEPGSGEVVWEQAGLRIFLDAESRLFLNGAKVDFQETHSETGFVVIAEGRSPQACGSGSAFVPVQVLRQH